MSNREFHRVWVEQCEVAREIRLRYGRQFSTIKELLIAAELGTS